MLVSALLEVILPFIFVHTYTALNDLLELRNFNFVEAVWLHALWMMKGNTMSGHAALTKQCSVRQKKASKIALR